MAAARLVHSYLWFYRSSHLGRPRISGRLQGKTTKTCRNSIVVGFPKMSFQLTIIPSSIQSPSYFVLLPNKEFFYDLPVSVSSKMCIRGRAWSWSLARAWLWCTEYWISRVRPSSQANVHIDVIGQMVMSNNFIPSRKETIVSCWEFPYQWTIYGVFDGV